MSLGLSGVSVDSGRPEIYGLWNWE